MHRHKRMMQRPRLDIELVFRSIGIKATSQRKEILQAFYDSQGPVTADQIAAMIGKIDKVTLYRTLDTFTKYLVIKKLNLSSGISFYEINDTHHHHIVCKTCNFIEEIDSCEIGTLVPHSKKFSFISEHSLEFFGICKKCAQ